MTTLDYYNQNARATAERYRELTMEPWFKPFFDRVPAGGKILDLGSGSGRELKAFAERGYDVSGLDGSAELAKQAEAYSGVSVRVMRFDQLEDQDCYDGIWANASLLHVPRAAFLATLERVARALKVNGVLFMSFKYGTKEGFEWDRFFCDWDEALLTERLQPFEQLKLLDMQKVLDLRPGRNIDWLFAWLQRIAWPSGENLG